MVKLFGAPWRAKERSWVNALILDQNFEPSSALAMTLRVRVKKRTPYTWKDS